MTSHQVLTVEQMQAAEQALIDNGISVDHLMQTAGNGAAEWVWRMAAGRPVTLLCGPGNNGGDGYVIAENLRRRGLAVNVVAPFAPKTPAANKARKSFQAEIHSAGNGVTGAILVDCLFGSGLKRPLSAELLLLLRDLAGRHALKIAIDLPSGIDSDSGALLNERLPDYDLTIALGAWKFAHWQLPARQKMGSLKLVPIGVGEVDGAARLVNRPTISPPAAEAHKYTRGLCAIICGEMPGATMLAARGAMHSGAGYVKILAGQSVQDSAMELVIDRGELTQSLRDDRISALLIGPGLGRGTTAINQLQQVLAMGKPTVLDADALMLLRPEILPDGAQVLATPHDGELETLCKTFGVIAQDRRAKALALARASGMAILAKGPDSYIAAPKGAINMGMPAPSWLSTAGSGDVLAGIAAGRMATGKSPMEAAREALWLHGEAAKKSGAAFTAAQLADNVAHAVMDAIR